MTHGRLAVLKMPLDGRDIDWRGKVVNDGVEHCLDAFVLERGATEYRHYVSPDRGAANGVTNLLD